jgi:replicative DNA helicase
MKIIKSKELEEIIIGQILIDENAYMNVRTSLNEDDFSIDKNKQIYKTIEIVYALNQPINILTVFNEISKTQNDITAHDIAEYTNKVAISTNIEKHVFLLKQKTMTRKLQNISMEILKRCDVEEDIFETIEYIQTNLNKLTDINTVNDIVHVSEVVNNVYDKIVKGDKRNSGILTGFDYFDKKTGGLQRGELIVLSGEASQGKTALVLSMLHQLTSNHTGIFFSLEMTSEMLVNRLLSHVSGVNSNLISRCQITGYDLQSIIDNKSNISNKNLFITDKIFSLNKIINFTKSFNLQRKIDFIVIDYLQLINFNVSGLNQEQKIDGILRELKQLAKELDIPIILISSLSKSPDTNKPTNARLKYSSSIEYTADIIMFVYRPEIYGIETIKIPYAIAGKPNITIHSKGKAEILITKGRNCGIFEFITNFDSSLTLFTNYEYKDNDLYAATNLKESYQF